MSWDTVFLVAGGLSLFQAFLSLLIGRVFVRNGQQRHALNAMWYVLVALVFGLALAAIAQQMQIGDLKQEVEHLQDRLDES